MAVIGPDFPKCLICGKDMHSISADEVPNAAAKEMVRYNRYQPLNPNYWYKCDKDDLIFHKLAVKAR
jgi:hypothetical protein